MEYPVVYFTPDYTDDWEWGLTQQLGRAMPRSSSWEGLIVFLILAGILLSFILLKILFVALRRLWDVYQERATKTPTGRNVLKWSALGLLMLWALALLVAGLWPPLAGVAFVAAAAGLLAYTCLSEWIDYQASKTEPPPALPDNLSIQDIITFKNEVDRAALGVPTGA